MRWMGLMSLLLGTAGCSLCAQQPTTAGTQSTAQPYVLHVYANLVQVPTLVLDTNFKPMPPVPIKDFQIRLDSGPSFHPVKMHTEGEEPISLAILLDASGAQAKLMDRFADDFATVATTSLRPHDHVSIFALDCALVQSARYLPADAPDLKESLTNVLASPLLHDGKEKGSCGRRVRVWDAAGRAIDFLSHQPGHRVLMMVSSGYDRKSNTTWAGLEELAAVNDVTIFGVRELMNFEGDYGYQHVTHLGPDAFFAAGNPREDLYLELCERNGGIILTTLPSSLPSTLQNIVSMLRGRYIIEFPRPDDSTPGRHVIDVTLQSHKAFIATAAVEVPLPNDGRDADPATVKSAPSPAVLGKRHGLKSN